LLGTGCAVCKKIEREVVAWAQGEEYGNCNLGTWRGFQKRRKCATCQKLVSWLREKRVQSGPTVFPSQPLLPSSKINIRGVPNQLLFGPEDDTNFYSNSNTAVRQFSCRLYFSTNANCLLRNSIMIRSSTISGAVCSFWFPRRLKQQYSHTSFQFLQ
jgi:hypothetical protein